MTEFRTALVTGGAKRVGAALSRHLAAKGYAVAVHYNSSSKDADALVDEIKLRGGKAAAVKADLADGAETERLISLTADALSAPSVLINNASLFIYDEAKDFSVETWDRQISANLRAPAILARDLANALPETEEGCIINFLDQKVFNPSPIFFSYTVSKTGLERLTQMLAIAMAPRIRVGGVAPGLTLPSGKQTQEQFEEAHNKTLLGKGSTVDGLLAAVDYLLESEVVTGQVLYVDGGERFSGKRNYKDMIE